MRLTRRCVLAAAIGVLALGALPVAARAPLSPGQPAPSFELSDGDGRPVTLASLKGRVVLVDFWASWCGPCQAAFPATEELYQQYRSRGFEVVAINLDEKRQDADAFLAARPHAMTVAFDPNGKTPKAFGVDAMPTSFVIGRDGRIRFVHTGYTSATQDSYKREIEQLLEEQ